MNILVDTLPETIRVGGVDHEVSTDFRTCLRAILALEDPELTQDEKAAVVLTLLYGDRQPADQAEGLRQAAVFLGGGVEYDEDAATGPRVYSFEKDAGLIFAAFKQTHGVDLTREEMHWWKFLALFMDLGADTAFCTLVNLRRRVKTGVATREEQQTARDIGEAMDLPEVDTRTLEEREAEAAFMAALRGSDG